MINGVPTLRINVGRGCRQGDPIAGYLFILCVEILLLKICSLEKITPWTSNLGTKKLIDAYTDEINIFIAAHNSPKQIRTIVDTMEQLKEF